jgi:hypothetical protein
MNPTREWRRSTVTEGIEVSSDGYLRRVGCENVYQPFRTKKGYLTIKLNRKNWFVHRLVAHAFCGQRPSDQHEVNHKNGVKDDNRAGNLEWVTCAENIAHATEVLGHRAGEKNPFAKLTEQQVRAIKTMSRDGVRNFEITRKFGLPKSTVRSIIVGQSWAHVQV